jgi:putative nucleotidyltransferase with HDIG domain
MNLAKAPARRRVYLVALLLVSVMLGLLAVLAPMFEDPLAASLQEGQVATQDYRAERAMSYISQIRTEQRRAAAEQAISPIFTSPDTRVARRQLEQLRTALGYIQTVRADAYASTEQKLADLQALEEVALSQDSAATLLTMSDTRWQEVQQQALAVLERVMSSGIRPETLVDARSRVPALVSLSLPEEQAAVVADLVTSFTAPNSEYSESLTLAARSRARESIEPITRTFVPGQTVALQGEVLDAEDIEALHQLGLAQTESSWQDLVSAASLTLLMAGLIVFYARRKQSMATTDVRRITVVAALFLIFLLSARLIIPTHTIIPYAFPISAYGLTIAALFGVEIAVVTSLPLVILAAYGLPNSMELTLYYLVSTLFGVLALGRARRLVSFAFAGLAVGVTGSVIVLIFRLPLPTTDWVGLATLTAAAFFNGLASASITILLNSALAHFLGSITAIQLVDLTRPDHPLLRLLLREAPGTYQHSLQVANLAEQAAERIGADALLTRVGSLYHDIGKTANPVFFIENQPPGFINPHEGLSAEQSAALIIRHVTDGLELGRKNHLPQRILDFVLEHHGTGLTRYQYYNAVQAAGGDESQVDKDKFTYPGPRPQSRETAILMLADGSEARVRAERPDDDEKLRAVIKSAIKDRIASGQLDDTKLTLNDLALIAESFTATLRGLYHPRLTYPRLEQASQEAITLPLPRKSEAPVEHRT